MGRALCTIGWILLVAGLPSACVTPPETDPPVVGTPGPRAPTPATPPVVPAAPGPERPPPGPESGESRPAGPTAAEALAEFDTARALEESGRCGEALRHARRAEELATQVHGDVSEDHWSALHLLSRLLEVNGEPVGAAAAGARMADVGRRLYGENEDYALDMLRAGNLYYGAGQLSPAEAAYREALDAGRRVFAPGHPALAGCLALLGQALLSSGHYRGAASALDEAASIYESLGPELEAEAAKTMNNLAVAYFHLGQLDRAVPLATRVVEIRERLLGPDHPSVGVALANLAALCMKVGNWERAQPLLERALAIQRTASGERSRDTAAVLMSLGNLHFEQSRNDLAEASFREALSIFAGNPEDEIDRAWGLTSLSSVLEATNRDDEAEAVLREALAIRIGRLGEDHPLVASTLNNLAVICEGRGRSGEAETLYRRALALRRDVLGSEHPDVATSLDNLAIHLASRGRVAEAFGLVRESRRCAEARTEMVFSFTDEGTKLRYLATISGMLDMHLSFVLAFLAEDPAAVRFAADAVLRTRGLTLAAFGRQREAVALGDDPGLGELWQGLLEIRRELGEATLAGPGPEGREAHRERLAALAARRDGLDAELTRRSAAFAATRREDRADTVAVAAALPEGSALVEFALPATYRFGAVRGEAAWAPPRYLAFVIPAGGGGRVDLVDLGPEEAMDRAVGAFRTAVGETGRAFDPGAKATGRTEARGRVDGAARALFDAAFAPLMPAIGGARRLFLCPEGALCAVPFEALLGPDGRFVVEGYEVSYLSAGRDLLRRPPVAEQTAGRDLILADPDFGPIDAGGGRAAEGRGPGYPGRRFVALPGTAEEAGRIASLLGAPPDRLRTGPAATKRALMEARAPRVLHIATHGFFLREVRAGLANPLLRSGLALAGANIRPAGGRGGDEGILTALEVTGLDLLGTELVTLSACETGSGEVLRGEGVFGLCRAFQIAGARTLLTSLWRVPDEETADLMVGFYRRFVGGEGKAEALRGAQRELMEALRGRTGYAHPFHWAGFVLVGDAR